jgi:rubrerythrin
MTTNQDSPSSQIRKRSCFNLDGKPKLRFNTRAEAKEWERTMRVKYPNNKPLGQYRCEHCGYFHNGEYPTEEEARAGKRRRHHGT